MDYIVDLQLDPTEDPRKPLLQTGCLHGPHGSASPPHAKMLPGYQTASSPKDQRYDLVHVFHAHLLSPKNFICWDLAREMLLILGN